MGLYIYQNPDDPEDIIEVSQAANDTYPEELSNGSIIQIHKYFDENGRQWKRIFTIPHTASNMNMDPFSQKRFVDKTKNVKTYGEAWRISKEMSEMRSDKIGAPDPQKIAAEKKFYKGKN